jgi:hypothetical protein
MCSHFDLYSLIFLHSACLLSKLSIEINGLQYIYIFNFMVELFKNIKSREHKKKKIAICPSAITKYGQHFIYIPPLILSHYDCIMFVRANPRHRIWYVNIFEKWPLPFKNLKIFTIIYYIKDLATVQIFPVVLLLSILVCVAVCTN